MKKASLLMLATALAWGCGGSVKGEGDADTDATTDTSTEMTGDVDTDVDEDSDEDVVVPDAVEDVLIDTPTDGTGCTDGEMRCSSDDTAMEECVSGAWDSTPCPYGCSEDPDVHCMSWDISNIPDDDLLSLGEDYCGDPWPSDTDMDYEMRMDTDTGQIDIYEFTDGWTHVLEIRPADRGLNPESCIGFTVVDQGTDLPEIGVFSFQEFNVPDNYVVSAYGSRPMAILSEDAATIDGGVYVGCNWRDSEPYGGAVTSDNGAGAGGAGDSRTVSSTGVLDGGGGGGAFGGAGGTGGGDDTSLQGAPGTPYGTPELIPLLAGSGGGEGADPGSGHWGGRSGGALLLVSGDTLTITGWVDASGCGGRTPDRSNEGGGGGGSGGGIILESPALVITGEVSANGGGGASGGGGGEDGENGLVGSDTAAAGGTAGSSYACDGGDGNGGGGADGSDAPGCDYETDGYFNAGGGGGGSGIIRLNGGARVLTDALLSPDLSSGACTEADLTTG